LASHSLQSLSYQGLAPSSAWPADRLWKPKNQLEPFSSNFKTFSSATTFATSEESFHLKGGDL
jgi:hypothetical protein